MQTETAEDIESFFKLDEFAHSAIYNSQEIKVHFFNESIEVTLEDNTVISSSPYVLAIDTDIAGIAHGDAVTIASESDFRLLRDGLIIGDFNFLGNPVIYYITGIEPDGTGITKLILSKDSDQ